MSRIHSILSVAALGLLVSVGTVSAGSPRIEKETSVSEFKKTFLFGGGREQNGKTGGVSASSTSSAPSVDSTQDVDPNPYGLDPKEMERATREAARQVENLAKEIRNLENNGGGGVDPNYNGIDAPY